MIRIRPGLVTGCSSVLWGLVAVASEASPVTELSFADRVAAQRAIEAVYWNHRIWPEPNPQPKPPLSAVISEEMLPSRVEDYLRKSNALTEVWGRPITAAQLQAEMERMARSTKSPEVLAELFAALNDDAALIAETLVRPKLVERLLRNAYAHDERFHGAVQREAETALARVRSGAALKSQSGVYSETTWSVRDASGSTGAAEEAVEHGTRTTVRLEADEWDEFSRELKAKSGSRIEETTDAFSLTKILSIRPDEITTATVSWSKKPFDSWWSEERGRHGVALADRIGIHRAVRPQAGSCTGDTWKATPLDVPDPRTDHNAVWTGTEMIIWGGSATSRLNSGGRYDPSTDTWMTTSMEGVPSAAPGVTAVWTGTEMIVWSGSIQTGGRYNPISDTWAATSTGAGLPSVRSGQSAVWTGTKMIIWGGSNSGAPMNTGASYDPSTDMWSATSTGTDVPAARFSHTAIWTGTEMIVWGGNGGANTVLNTGGRYDPAANTWSATSTGTNVPSGRQYGCSAVWTGNEMIVWGGYAGGVLFANTGGRYDPSMNTWSTMSTGTGVPSGRANHRAVWTGTEMIVWGGWNGAYFNTGARFDPSTDTWTETSTGANVPTSRAGHTAVWTGTEMIAWGGSNGTVVNTGGRYNPASNTWNRTSTGTVVPTARYDHTAVWTGTEMIVWGGRRNGGPAFNSGGRYDPSTDTWMPTSTGTDVPSARSGHKVVWTGTEMIIWGGVGTSTGGRYNPTADTWKATSIGAGVPSWRTDHTAVWSGTLMIIWGGSNGASFLNSGGRYDPSNDTWSATAIFPLARRSHTAVWTGTRMIIWGGYDGSERNTGARYDPGANSWTLTSEVNAPVPRQTHTAIWTGARMIVWGGFAGGSYMNFGGQYDPTSDLWTPTWSAAGVPSGRSDHTAVWTGGDMIVWGGQGPVNTGGRYVPSIDTWFATSTGEGVPSPRLRHTAVWTGQAMLIWGGGYSEMASGGLYCAAVPCVPAPINNSLTGAKSPTAATYSWNDPPGPYHVYRGLSSLSGWQYNHTLFAAQVPFGPIDDVDVPPVGRFYYYLVTRTGCGESTPAAPR